MTGMAIYVKPLIVEKGYVYKSCPLCYNDDDDEENHNAWHYMLRSQTCKQHIHLSCSLKWIMVNSKHTHTPKCPCCRGCITFIYVLIQQDGGDMDVENRRSDNM